MNPLSLLLGGLGGLFQTGYGIYQTLHGNKKLNQLEANRPQYTPNQNIQDMANFASQFYNAPVSPYDTTNIERGLGSTIGAIQSGGGGLGYINQAYQTANTGFQDLMREHAKDQLYKAQFLDQAKKDLAEEQLRAFNYNVADPYAEKYNRYVQQTNNTNITGGLNQLGSLATGLGNFGFGGNGNKTSNPNGGYDWANNYGGQSGFQSYQNQPSPNFGQFNWMYNLPNYSWHP